MASARSNPRSGRKAGGPPSALTMQEKLERAKKYLRDRGRYCLDPESKDTFHYNRETHDAPTA